MNAGPVPEYALLDLWMALSRRPEDFDTWREDVSYADAHSQLLAWVRERQVRPITEETLNQMAQWFYEATPTIVYPTMTMKPDIVEGLRSALTRAGIIRGPLAVRKIVEAWNIIYLHDDCPDCEACADRAIAHAQAHFLVSDQWTLTSPTGDSVPFVAHKAIIERA